MKCFFYIWAILLCCVHCCRAQENNDKHDEQIDFAKLREQIQNGKTEISASDLKGCVEIPDRAFYKCVYLTSITLPESVTKIGAFAFSDCYRLTFFTIPKGVTRIEVGTFFRCQSLNSVVIPEGVTEIGRDVFVECLSLTSVEFRGMVKKIGYKAFSECGNLKSVSLHEGLECIDDLAFFPVKI